MAITDILDYDILPTGRSLRITCYRPATHCSIACIKNMRGLNYNESVQNDGNIKTIVIEPDNSCDYQMAQGLYIVASNICRACRIQEQLSR